MQPSPSQGSPLDPKALFEAHGAFVRTLARAMVADEHMAEDLAHDTWAAVVSRPPVGVRDVRAWLSTILQRRVASYRRGQRKTTQIDSAESFDPESAQGAADDAVQQLEYEHVLHSAVRALKEPYRSTVYLRFHEGLPPRTIAARAGVPVKTVKTRLSRALEKLRATLDEGFRPDGTSGHDWRHALAPVGAASLSASKLATSGTAVQLGSSTTPLLFGMKKFIVVAAVLLASAAWLFQRAAPSDLGIRTEPGAPGQVALIDAEPELAAEELPDLAAPAPSEVIRQDAGAPQAARVAEAENALIIVHVRDENALPIPGRSIVLRTWPFASSGEPRIVRRTDADGRVAFPGLSASHYLLQDGLGKQEEDFTVEPGETRDVSWTVKGDVLVRGRVLDDRGGPIAGAEVWGSASHDDDGFMSLAARTDATGGFMVRCYAGAVLQATAPGLIPSMAQQVQLLPEVDPGVREVTLTLKGRGVTLTGRVIDANGDPIKAASIIVQPDAWPTYSDSPGAFPRPTAAVTGPDGRFAYASGLPMGQHVVVVRAPNFATKVTTVLVQDRPVEIEVTLHGGVEVSGTVTQADGSPSAQAHVWVSQPTSRWQAYGNGHGPLVVADDEGRFTLRRVPPGLTAVRARAGWKKGTLTRGAETVEVFEERLSDLQIMLQAGRTISGRIVDLDGAPIEGRVVTAFGVGAKSNDVTTSADGTYQISSLPEPDGAIDEWDVIVRTWTGTNTRLLGKHSGVAPHTTDVDFVIDRLGDASATIVGRIVGEKVKVPGDIEVILGDQGSAGGSSIPIDLDTGAFTKSPLLPGTYRIRVLRAGVPVVAKSDLVVGPGETIDAGVIRLDDGGSIEVRPSVLNALPIEPQRLSAKYQGATASMVGPGGNEVQLEWSDGAWRHAGTLEAGRWRVGVLAEGLFLSEQTVTLEPGAAARVDLPVALGQEVDVRVDLPSEPDAWSEVKITIRDGSGRVLYSDEPIPRAALLRPTLASATWTVPLEMIRISVTTDTEVGAEKTVVITPGHDRTWTVPISAR